VGHANGLPLRDVVTSGQRSIEHVSLPRMDSLTSSERSDLFTQYARRGGALVPTMVVVYRSLMLPDSVLQRLFDDGIRAGNARRPRVSRFLEIDWREQMSERDSNTRSFIARAAPAAIASIRELRAAGVAILAGSDLGVLPLYPGESLHDEIVLLVRQLGMTPLEALAAATRGPAAFVGTGDSLGTIAPGMLADLVLLDADPTADIENVRRIRGVMLGGRWYDRAALDALLAGVAAAPDVQRNDWVR
jgi:hypothetical protein